MCITRITASAPRTAITGLGNAGAIAYDTVEHLNIFLGSGGDTFTIQGTHAAETALNTNAGTDITGFVTVTDAEGKVLYSKAGLKTAGAHDFEWNGELNSGGTAAAGKACA